MPEEKPRNCDVCGAPVKLECAVSGEPLESFLKWQADFRAWEQAHPGVTERQLIMEEVTGWPKPEGNLYGHACCLKKRRCVGITEVRARGLLKIIKWVRRVQRAQNLSDREFAEMMSRVMPDDV